ncbi:MAG: hypothetical protein KY468_13225 [Armatimonadetes bacterium]|nr:hypothetical protein [Armatimonadota bacterium]
MNRSVTYAVAGVLLTGLAAWIVKTRMEGESLASTPLDEVDRMMSQTRQKLGEIQKNLNDFRHVLTQATTLEQNANPAPSS